MGGGLAGWAHTWRFDKLRWGPQVGKQSSAGAGGGCESSFGRSLLKRLLGLRQGLLDRRSDV